MNRRVDRSGVNAKSATKKRRPNQRITQTNAGAKEAPSGARYSQTSLLSGFASWGSHHLESCHDALKRLCHLPVQSFLTCLVLAIAVTLPAALYSGLQSVGQLGVSWQEHTRLSAFIRQQAKPIAIEQLQQRLQDSSEFLSVELVTPEQAKQEFIEHSGLGSLLQGIESNPLPAVLLLTPTPEIASTEQLQVITNRLQQEVLIETVQMDIVWLQRLQAMMHLVQNIVIAIACLLIVGMLLNLANTIRLTIENRRKEIIVSKLVGATDAFIQRPFLYTGFWYGLGGGLGALILLQLLQLWLFPAVERLLFNYGSEYSLSLLSFQYGAFIIAVTTVLGLASAWLAVIRHLKAIEPE